MASWEELVDAIVRLAMVSVGVDLTKIANAGAKRISSASILGIMLCRMCHIQNYGPMLRLGLVPTKSHHHLGLMIHLH